MAERTPITPPLLAPAIDRIALLRTTGNQFTDQKNSRVPLPGITYTNWRRNQVPAIFDPYITIHGIGELHARDPKVQFELDRYRKRSPSESLTTFLQEKLKRTGLIIGFSGYASDGFHYEAETEGIQAVLQASKRQGIPIDLIVDGGTSLGIPGLSGLLAQQESIATLGCIPLEGLRSVGVRDTTIVLGETYGDETHAIGTIPDILIVLGGGPNAAKEYQTALNAGNIVLMVHLKEYPSNSLINTFESLPGTQDAIQQGKVIVCNNLESIGEFFASIDDLKMKEVHKNRNNKTQMIKAI